MALVASLLFYPASLLLSPSEAYSKKQGRGKVTYASGGLKAFSVEWLRSLLNTFIFAQRRGGAEALVSQDSLKVLGI
jgi:hypothetical protein